VTNFSDIVQRLNLKLKRKLRFWIFRIRRLQRQITQRQSKMIRSSKNLKWLKN